MNSSTLKTNLLDCIGNTPLLKLNLGINASVFAKLEYLNPSGSIKDRTAYFMIQYAEKKGLLNPEGTIVEATSGNQGIALAMIGALKKYNVIITLPERTSREKIEVMKSYGTSVHIYPNVSEHNDPKGYYAQAKKILKNTPNTYMPDQYFNTVNADAHYHTTGPEIWQQTQGKITHLIIGAGTCGTISGIGKYLKEKNKDIKIIGVDAATSWYSSKAPKPYNIEGIGIDAESKVFNKNTIDHIIPVEDEDAFSMTKTLALKYGLLVGLSSGAVIHTIVNKFNNLSSKATIVTIFADSGKYYFSKLY
jgi:cystathionine beta-synthase